ncbi:MAG: hypothetical protein FJ224_04015 [Lentisphaerae bacterium]|nr:hypothetical protein [Lentisphaerota bacterium]
MKIPLNMNGEPVAGPDRLHRLAALTTAIAGARRGDWNSKRELLRMFHPLLGTLAEKRTSDPAEAARLVKAGEEGVVRAARRFPKDSAPDHFEVFALKYIEKRMDAGPGGWLSRLFGRA